jgi:hypothetical protein
MDSIHAYREKSKQHLDRNAPGPGGLDWNSQPDPCRRYAGAPEAELPLLAGDLPARWDDLFGSACVPANAMTADRVACLLQLSLGLSAWKSYGGNRWALRCNASSGNLHSTEAYLISSGLPGWQPVFITTVRMGIAANSARRRRSLDPAASCWP